jgi:hypothetical protein
VGEPVSREGAIVGVVDGAGVGLIEGWRVGVVVTTVGVKLG